VGESYIAERQRKRKCERESLGEKRDSVGTKIRTFSQISDGNVI
jgi:hypothetical protein